VERVVRSLEEGGIDTIAMARMNIDANNGCLSDCILSLSLISSTGHYVAGKFQDNCALTTFGLLDVAFSLDIPYDRIGRIIEMASLFWGRTLLLASNIAAVRILFRLPAFFVDHFPLLEDCRLFVAFHRNLLSGNLSRRG
jgi:hypothetical protein